MNEDIGNRRIDRREMFQQWGVWTVGGIFSFLLGAPLVGYFGSVLFKKEAEQWARVCSLDEIGTDTPKEFTVSFKRTNAPQSYEEVRAVLVIRKGADILAFTNVCTHMGCSVRWLDWRQQILCPCHGGMYDRWGNLAGGPPAHSLPLYVSRIEGDALFVTNRFIERG